MPKNPEGLQQLLVEELQDLLDAEKMLVRTLPKMAKSATDEELENAFREHLEVTKGQVQRLEQVFQTLDAKPRSRPCKGMRGIIEEGQEMMQEELPAGLLDTALTASGRKVEHYEMVGYESVRSLARQMGLREAADLLEETLHEEIQADKQLATIGKRLLKQAPVRSEDESKSSGKKTGARGRSVSTRGRSRSSSSRAGKSAHPLTDHEEIRQWAEKRGAEPACVRGTGGQKDVGMIRLDFPGYSGEESLEHISWDKWFEKFDERSLALMIQDTTAGGEQSNFNKLVSRESAGGTTRTARS